MCSHARPWAAVGTLGSLHGPWAHPTCLGAGQHTSGPPRTAPARHAPMPSISRRARAASSSACAGDPQDEGDARGDGGGPRPRRRQHPLLYGLGARPPGLARPDVHGRAHVDDGLGRVAVPARPVGTAARVKAVHRTAGHHHPLRGPRVARGLPLRHPPPFRHGTAALQPLPAPNLSGAFHPGLPTSVCPSPFPVSPSLP